MAKICTKCSAEKELSEFNFASLIKGTYRGECRDCQKAYFKKFYSINIDNQKIRQKQCRQQNRDKIKQKRDIWYKENPDYSKKYYSTNKEKEKVRVKKWSEVNQERIKQNKQKWLILNPNYDNNYRKKRKAIDSLFRLTSNLRTMIGNVIVRKGFTKTSRTHEILGCSFEAFKFHLESKFETWMNWENYGKYNGTECYGWDIDHIIPLSSAKSEDELFLLNHHSNLQPLCSYKNRQIKRDKIL